MNAQILKMNAQIYSYKKIIVPGPDGYTLYARLPDGGMELTELDGITYVTIPTTSDPIPEQHEEVILTPVVLDDALRRRIIDSSRACYLIKQSMLDKIREKYSVDDEMYFARIGAGSASGFYTLEPGELEQLTA